MISFKAHLFAGKCVALLLCFACEPGFTQGIVPTIVNNLENEIIVTASGRASDSFTTPFSTLVINSNQIQLRRQSRTLPELFFDDPSIMVQKTSNGQGSPYLRGFTGFRTLLLIDGIRVNNAIFREGPNEYWNTLDHFTIDQVEVVKGPSSVLYGSDSIGGTVNIQTIAPVPNSNRDKFWNIKTISRLADADSSFVQRIQGDVALGEKLGILFGATAKNYNDVQSGGSTGNQPHTGYVEADEDLKITYRLNDTHSFTFARQQVNQEDAWRTHATKAAVSWRGTSIGSDQHRIIDQSRSLTYLQYQGTDLAPALDSLRISLSYQDQEEFQNRLRSNSRTELQGASDATTGIFVQAHSPSPAGYLVYGAEFYQDEVDSFFRSYNPNGSLRETRIQGPVADDASTELFAAYIQNQIPLLDGRGELVLGARYTQSSLDADAVLDPVTNRASTATGDWDNLTGSVRFSYAWNANNFSFIGASQGFRSPNLSDLTRLDNARTNEIETPSTGLNAEDFITYEFGNKIRNANSYVQVSYFYTDVKDQIIRFPTGVVLDKANEVQKANIGDGYIHGIEFNAQYNLSANWEIFSAFAWTEGRLSTYPTSQQIKQDEPIDRMLPTNGIVGLRWSNNTNTWLELHARVVDNQERLSTRDREDTSRMPPGGSPGYTIFNLRGGITLGDSTEISIAAENISDKNYRVHGSGQNEPGRNLIMSVQFQL